MKTVIQELIEKLESFKNELREKYDSDPLSIRGVSISIAEAKKLLEKEKQQIENAFNKGQTECFKAFDMIYPEHFSVKERFDQIEKGERKNEDFEYYYEQTYQKN